MISPNQLICILLLSRLSSEIIFPNSGGLDGNTLAAAVIGEVACFILALPAIIYSAMGRSLYGAVSAKSRAAGAVLSYAAGFLTVWLAARCALYTAEFAQRGLVTEMSGAVLAVLMGAFAVYSAVKGIEALSRAGLLFAAAAAVLTAVTVFADIPYIELRSIGGAQPDSSFLTQIWNYMLRGGEYLAFAALLPYVRKREKGIGTCSAVLIFAISALVGVVLIMLFNMSVLGEFYGMAKYPLVAASELADITLFKRLDAFTCAVWAACSGLKCALLLYSGYAAVKAATSRKIPAVQPKGEPA